MKRFLWCVCMLLCSVYSSFVRAEVTPYMAQNLSPAALNNILNSEKVFCYTVEMAAPDYAGYTLDQLALTGYCGQLKEERAAFVKEFFETPSNILETLDSCKIAPKVMLRFIRGVDSADVLFSDTCPSVTVFYGGTRKTFNAAPAKKTLEAVISVLSRGRTDFVSPALLDELMPCGVVLNDEQKELVNKHKSARPTHQWEQKKQNQPQAQPQENVKGWNKLRSK